MKTGEFQSLLGAKLVGNPDFEFTRLSIDSRIISYPLATCFFAIKTESNDGHKYISHAQKQGVRCFVVETIPALDSSVDVCFIQVENPIRALQKLASEHRKRLDFPLVGITGSNGKTVVKEWLFQLISGNRIVGRSPASFNSQIGVPLSLWGLREHMEVGLLEVGISKPGEMIEHSEMVRPEVGVFTHVGTAHLQNFESVQQLVNEKCLLFRNSKKVIYPSSQNEIRKGLASVNFQGSHWTWGEEANDVLRILPNQNPRTNRLAVEYDGKIYTLTLRETHQAAKNNVLTSVLTALALDVSIETVLERLDQLSPVELRLQRTEGSNGATLISDTYNSDLPTLELALDELQKSSVQGKKVAIISDILQTGIPDKELYKRVALSLEKHVVDLFIGVGEAIGKQKTLFKSDALFFENTEALLRELDALELDNNAILIKGARPFYLERVAQRLQSRIHVTVLEINRESIVQNLNYFRKNVQPSTKIMAMVKAFGYGTGGSEIAELLAYHGIDYLGVAYVNEGVAIREAGINIPIFVINPSPGSFYNLIRHRLEPEVFSFEQLEQLRVVLTAEGIENYPIHLMFDTGMHRLGFNLEEVNDLIDYFKQPNPFEIKGILSHLAAADDPAMDDFTRTQINRFNSTADTLSEALDISPIRHICNTAGMQRFPEAQGDMVRLGIGLYGISVGKEDTNQIVPVASLKTRISQIREIPAGEGVSYGHTDAANHPRTIATLPVGYADGYRRSLSNGKGKVLLLGQLVPVVGKVCMDMIMVDVTGLGAKTGDEAVLFGITPKIETIAKEAETIPYEIIAAISSRIKRVYL